MVLIRLLIRKLILTLLLKVIGVKITNEKKRRKRK